MGEKSKGQLGRALPNNLALSFSQVGVDVPTFGDASAIADTIVKSGIKFDKVSLEEREREKGPEWMERKEVRGFGEDSRMVQRGRDLMSGTMEE